MLVRFWGTRGSIAKPGPGTVRYGGNTSCVELRSSSGTLAVLDCGTGAHGLGQALVTSEPSPLHGHILIGHTHWDHIQGFPFFAPLIISGNEWHVYGPRGVGSSLLLAKTCGTRDSSPMQTSSYLMRNTQPESFLRRGGGATALLDTPSRRRFRQGSDVWALFHHDPMRGDDAVDRLVVSAR